MTGEQLLLHNGPERPWHRPQSPPQFRLCSPYLTPSTCITPLSTSTAKPWTWCCLGGVGFPFKNASSAASASFSSSSSYSHTHLPHATRPQAFPLHLHAAPRLSLAPTSHASSPLSFRQKTEEGLRLSLPHRRRSPTPVQQCRGHAPTL